MSSSSSSSSASYAQLLERTLLPFPSFQRLAVVSIFQKLRAEGDLSSSAPARDALSRCLSSPLPPVLDQSVRELFRLLPAPLALLELLPALDGCPSPSIAPLYVKAIGLASRLAFRHHPSWRQQLADSPSTLHPFVRALSCQYEVKNEVLRQVVLFVVQNLLNGVDAVFEFLHPVIAFSVLKIASSAEMALFVKDLMQSIAAAACSFPLEGMGIINCLAVYLKLFPYRDEKDFKLFFCCAEYLVEAFIEVSKQLTGAKRLTIQTKACCLHLLDILVSVSIDLGRPFGGSDVVSQLSQLLLVAYKELGLDYQSEFVMVTLSLSITLAQLELEHEQLSILKLLIYIIEWKSELQTKGKTPFSIQEFLLLFPAANLLSSPSKPIKAAATRMLSMLERCLVDSLVNNMKIESSYVEIAAANKPEVIISRFLHRIWFQEQAFQSCVDILDLVSAHNPSSIHHDKKLVLWIYELTGKSISTIEKPNPTNTTESGVARLSGVHILLSIVSTILVLHPKIGDFAADFLTAVCRMDPRANMPLFMTTLFYSKIFCGSKEMSGVLLRLIEMLPSLALHSLMVPLIVQTISPMLHKNVKQSLNAIAIRLLCKTWAVSDKCFGSLQEVLEKENGLMTRTDISLSVAASVCDVCKCNPDRGVDLIELVSLCIESQDSAVQAFGLESLSHLCGADVVDFYTAWKVIANNTQNYAVQPIVAQSLYILQRIPDDLDFIARKSLSCGLTFHNTSGTLILVDVVRARLRHLSVDRFLGMLLRWGSMDAEVYLEDSRNVIRILWDIATSRNSQFKSMWSKARAAAFESLVHYEVGTIHNSVTNFKEKNVEFLINENDHEILKASEKFEVNVIRFEHITRRRLIKEKRPLAHKVVKLLDLLPQAICTSEKGVREFPAALLLSHSFTPTEIQKKGTLKDLPKLHTVYEHKLLEVAECLQLSRNILFSLLALQSWKAFVSRWMWSTSFLIDSKSQLMNGNPQAANEILMILCRCAESSIPRIAENVVLAIGAFCMVLKPSIYSVGSTASDFLSKWLLQFEHEHRQWSAAISLGLVSNCLHATDRTRKHDIVVKLLKVLGESESSLVKGACGIGLGFACQDLRTSSQIEGNSNFEGAFIQNEAALLGKVIRSLCSVISSVQPSCSNFFENIFHSFPVETAGEVINHQSYGKAVILEDDSGEIRGMEGVIIGLGHTVGSLYRFGAYDAALKVKDFLLSCIPFHKSSLQSLNLWGEIPMSTFSIGASIILPTVAAFCEKTELVQNETHQILSAYSEMIAYLLGSKKSGHGHQSLLMASCFGAGTLVSCILNDGLQALKVDDVKGILEVIRTAYTGSNTPIIAFGGVLGVVNAFGASAGFVTDIFVQPSISLGNHSQETSYVSGPVISSRALEPFSTSIVQEVFMLAKESESEQIRGYAAWALSFLRHRWWSKEFQNVADAKSASQNFSEESLIWKLYLWLSHLQSSMVDMTVHMCTVITVLRCLRKAPRIPVFSDWGRIIRYCMKQAACSTGAPCLELACKLLREECVNFCIDHANNVEALLLFLDEIMDISRFSRLEQSLQLSLLRQLSAIVKVFHESRQQKLFADLVEFFTSSSLYLANQPHQKCLMRISFWKGLLQCLELSDKLDCMPNLERCMEILFSQLPVFFYDDNANGTQDSSKEEWSEAVKCLANSRLSWLMNLLQVGTIKHATGGRFSSVHMKVLLAMARLISTGHIPITELGMLKGYLFTSKFEGSWPVLIEVAVAVFLSESNFRRQWLLDIVDIGIISFYPSMALQFIGILSSICCQYRPLLVIDPVTVLSDLPVTLPSLLLESGWVAVKEPLASKFWLLTERLFTWASNLQNGVDRLVSVDGIDASENHMSHLLVDVMLQTCLSFKDHLPFEKQLKLAKLLVGRNLHTQLQLQ